MMKAFVTIICLLTLTVSMTLEQTINVHPKFRRQITKVAGAWSAERTCTNAHNQFKNDKYLCSGSINVLS